MNEEKKFGDNISANISFNENSGKIAVGKEIQQISNPSQEDQTPPEIAANANTKKILILSVNPKDTNRLRLDEEVREIKTALQRSKNREQYEIITEGAVRVDDLGRALLDYQPTIIHFSGHGSGSDGLVLENNSGEMQLVSTESLAQLFGLFKTTVEFVLLNACYSEAQAEAIFKHINYVIGMNRAIGDKAAIVFAVGFYNALGAGRSYEDCFKAGCVSIALAGIPESQTPVMKTR